MTHVGVRRTTEPSRRCLCDWASLTSHVDNQQELEKVRETATKLISDHVRTYSVIPLKAAGNYFHGHKWEKFGATLRWSDSTTADLLGADYEGRCVNSLNIQLRGSSGIGRLPLSSAAELLEQLQAIGFSVPRRLDMSIDVFNHPALSVRLIADKLGSGDWKIPRRNPNSFVFHGPIGESEGKPKGSTLYIGTRDSDVQVVIYDKGAQQESEGAWIRFEARYKDEPAAEVFYRLTDAHNAAMDSADPEAFLDKAIVGVVRAAADIRDVSKYKGRPSLPKNWASTALTSYPELMHPVFAETAPLQIGGFKAANTFASRTRHLMRSSSKHMWRLAVISMAKGDNPGSVALTVGAPGAHSIQEEDWMEMSQVSGIPIAKLEKAEKKCLTALAKLHDLDVECIATDRTRMREEFARSLGGV